MRSAALAGLLLLAACSTEPTAVAPDASETAIAAASRAAVTDTEAAQRDAGMNGAS